MHTHHRQSGGIHLLLVELCSKGNIMADKLESGYSEEGESKLHSYYAILALLLRYARTIQAISIIMCIFLL